MRKSKTALRRSLVMNILALLMCVSMLIGTTFAWFTDTATTSVNKIQAGTLKIDLLQRGGANGAATGDYSSIKGMQAAIFDTSATANGSNKTLWEPGATHVAYLAVRNLGSLALKYNIIIDVTDNGLASALDYAIVPQAHLSDASGTNNCTATVADWAAAKAAPGATVGSLPEGDQRFTAAQGGCLDEIAANSAAKNETDYFALVIHMREDAGNVYQGTDALIDITVTASQKEAEYDSFNNTYDGGSTLPSVPERVKGNGESGEIRKTTGTTAGTHVTEGDGGATEKVNIKIEKSVSVGESSSTRTVADATVPAPAAIAVMDSMFTKENGFEEAPEAGENQTVTQDDALTLTLKVDTIEAKPASLKVDVKLNAIASRTVTIEETGKETLTTNKELPRSVTELIAPVTVELQLDKGLEQVAVTHSHDGAAAVQMTEVESLAEVTNGKFYYDKTTGLLTLKTNKFSEFEITYVSNEVCRIGTTPYSSLEDAADAFKTGDSIVLTKDVGTDLMHPTVKKDITVTTNGFGLIAEVAADKTLTVNEGEFKSFEVSGEGNVAITGGKFTAFSYTGDVKVAVSGGTFKLSNNTSKGLAQDALTADNLYLKDDGDSWYTVSTFASNVIAKIGNAGYTRMFDAFGAAENNTVIKMVANATENNAGDSIVATPIDYLWSGESFTHDLKNKTVTLDLNGKTITGGKDGLNFDCDSVFYITEWSGSYPNSYTIFTDTSEGKTGKVICTGTSSQAYCAIENTTHSLNNFVFEGGTYEGSTAAVIMQCGNLTINGGTFIGPNAIEYRGDEYSGTPTSKIIINGGTFDGEFYISVTAKLASITVNGGKFKTNTALKYLADGKIMVKEGDWYVVKDASAAPEEYTARVNDLYFLEKGDGDVALNLAKSLKTAEVELNEATSVALTLTESEDITIIADTTNYTAPVAATGFELKTENVDGGVRYYVPELKPFTVFRGTTRVGDYETFSEALSTANKSSFTVKLNKDYTQTTDVSYSYQSSATQDLTIDLQGHTLTFASNKKFNFSNKKGIVTVQNGTIIGNMASASGLITSQNAQNGYTKGLKLIGLTITNNGNGYLVSDSQSTTLCTTKLIQNCTITGARVSIANYKVIGNTTITMTNSMSTNLSTGIVKDETNYTYTMGANNYSITVTPKAS